MAGTRKPVSLLIHPSLDGPEMEKLREQGHKVSVMDCMRGSPLSPPPCSDDDYIVQVNPLPHTECDLILGPNCWWLPPEHIDLLPTALKAARETRYPPTEKKPAKRKKK